MRIALFTLESLAAAEAVRAFVARDPSRIVFIGISDPHRPAMGGMWGQMRRHVARSGLGFLPYLAVNFSLTGLLRRRDRLSDLARAHAIPWQWVRDVNGAQTAAALDAAQADVILSFHFDQIFRPDTLARARLGGINVHPGLLPRHRGPIPALYGLADNATGVTVHALDARIDTGAVLAQRALPLPRGSSASAAAAALHLAALPLVEDALTMLPATPAPAPVLPYCPFPDRAALRRMGVPLVRLRDIPAALAAPAGGW